MNRTDIREREVPALAQRLHTDDVVHRVLAARGVTSAAELDFSLGGLPGPETLPDIDVAVERLLGARRRNERLLVVGDYDCDGATSVAVALIGLRALGYRQVEYLVPDRIADGYGLSPGIVARAKEHYKPDLIVTVDNGIASVDGVDSAADAGIDVIVTDHHLPPDVLPKALALVNPSLQGSAFPSAHLAGVGVMFYVLIALRAALVASARVDEASAVGVKLAQLLDLVAIGTVADVVPLDSVNRILVEQGLRRIRAGQCRPGVAALLARAGCDASRACSADIGFALGPRLNAAGRLADMGRGIDCLLTDDPAAATLAAGELDRLNTERRQVETRMREEAEACLAGNVESAASVAVGTVAPADAFGVCLFAADWHAGVVGIVAGRLKERLHRPVVAFTSDGESDVKGSARSVAGVHVRDVLQNIASAHPGLIERFGGHAMAAGLTLPRARLEHFARLFDTEVRRQLDDRLPAREWLTDGQLPRTAYSLATARCLQWLMPWGQGCDAPLFNGRFELISSRVVGNGHLKLELAPIGAIDGTEASERHADGPKAPVREEDADALRPLVLDAIAFNESRVFAVGSRLRVVFGLDVNFYRDAEHLQLMVKHVEDDRARC